MSWSVLRQAVLFDLRILFELMNVGQNATTIRFVMFNPTKEGALSRS